MRRRGFTLVELLVVVGIIALLVAILMPSLEAARSMARSAICRGNLKQIGAAFQAAGAQAARSEAASTAAVYRPKAWPGVPINAVSTPKMYLCPEEGDKGGSINDYYIHSNYDGHSTSGTGLDIYFEPDDYLCRIVHETDDYIEYGFEDGVYPDLMTGTIDIEIQVTKRPPYIGTYVSPHYEGHPTGVLSLYCAGKVVPGWEDFRDVATGSTFHITGGVTNYGINAAVGRHVIAPDTIVLLDYNRLIANRDEDVGLELEDASQRHRGSINILHADQSVRGFSPTRLDPNIGDNADRWSPD